MELHFYHVVFWTAVRLTGRSAFVRSGALWSPFPLVASVVFLAFIVAFFFILTRGARVGPGVALRLLLRATFWALVAALGTLVVALTSTFLFEAFVYTPYVVMREAAENPPWEVRERFWSQGIKLAQFFKGVCSEGPIRIMDAPDRVPESAYLYGFLRSTAMTDDCRIANDQEDLNRQPDVDRPTPQNSFRPGITVHALPSHRAEADQITNLLASMSPPSGWHFENGSEMPQGTLPGTAIAIEIGSTLRLPPNEGR
jgi:hypothetical protein